MMTINLLIILLLVYTTNIFAVGVKPLIVDIDARPGEVKDFTLTFTPSGREELVKLSLFELTQLTDGSLTYRQADPEIFSAAGWVSLEKDEIMVYPGQNNTVKGQVRVPFDAAGSNTVVVMVEPQSPAQRQGGVNFVVRYAVRINIRVERPGVRPEAKLLDLGLISSEEGEPVVRARLSNPSAWDYLVSSEVVIRDDQRRLVERLPLRPLSAIRNNSNNIRMYPGSEVEYLAKVTKNLSPGTYSIRAFFRYGNHGQIIHNQKFTVKEGDFKSSDIGNRVFEVDKNKISSQFIPGQRRSEVIALNSQVGEDIFYSSR